MDRARLKAQIVRVVGPRMVHAAKRALGRTHFDEVDLVYKAFASSQRAGTMVDVGAHHGGSLGCFVADGWNVLAFEPDDCNRSILKIAHGHRRNLKIDDRAVADKCETGKAFFASDVSSGISGLSAFHDSHEKRQSVSVTTLADVLPACGIEQVDFLKIDTEGYDLYVLRGLNWGQVTPSIIVCEFEDRKTVPLGYRTDDLAVFLKGKGYQLLISEWSPIVEYGQTHKWRRFAPDTAALGENAWGNLIAYRQGTAVAGTLDQLIERYRGRS